MSTDSSTLPVAEAQRAAEGVRGHWAIENQLHWCLDVAFNEDQQRMRTGDAAANMALLSKRALNLLKRETSRKVGIKIRRLEAGWNDAYLLKVLTAGGGVIRCDCPVTWKPDSNISMNQG